MEWCFVGYLIVFNIYTVYTVYIFDMLFTIIFQTITGTYNIFMISNGEPLVCKEV